MVKEDIVKRDIGKMSYDLGKTKITSRNLIVKMKTIFIKKWLTNSFFFVENREQFETLQKIGIEFGLTNHIKTTELIEYDMHNVSKEIAPLPNRKVSKNLTFFPEGYFQESGFWVQDASYGEPKNYDKFIKEYNELNRELTSN